MNPDNEQAGHVSGVEVGAGKAGLPDIVLRLQEVTKSYGRQAGCADQQAGFASFSLPPTNLEIRRGCWTVITGRSGTGKTTLLQLLAGLDGPDAGRVWMFGHEVTHATEATISAIRRDRLGFVYQQFHFIEHLPVWQNVSCRLVPAGVTASQRMKRAQEVLGLFGLEDMAMRLPGELSGGEQQRVSLARAVINDPDVVIADEPTSNVDAETGAIMIDFLRGLKERNVTIVIASHDTHVKGAADVHHVMHDGRLS